MTYNGPSAVPLLLSLNPTRFSNPTHFLEEARERAQRTAYDAQRGCLATEHFITLCCLSTILHLENLPRAVQSYLHNPAGLHPSNKHTPPCHGSGVGSNLQCSTTSLVLRVLNSMTSESAGQNPGELKQRRRPLRPRSQRSIGTLRHSAQTYTGGRRWHWVQGRRKRETNKEAIGQEAPGN